MIDLKALRALFAGRTTGQGFSNWIDGITLQFPALADELEAARAELRATEEENA